MFGTKKIAAIFMLIVCTLNITAQEITIKGKLIDEKGAPIYFASVLIKGTKTGMQTDTTGVFKMLYKATSVTLYCSALGYESVEKKISAKDFKGSVADVTITLNSSTKNLDEVVVVGYATTKKKDMAYASSSVSSDRIVGAAPSITSRDLEGKASGVSITTTAPTIRIRGSASIAGSDDTYREKASGDKASHPAYKTEYEDKKITNLLTAGEVNDFKKWKMWEDYTAADFKTYSDKWNLYATQRYNVQLKNKDNKAVVGETVYLINKETNDTLWIAVSDNTGKAELWNDFSNNKKTSNLLIKVKNDGRQFNALPFSQGINHIELNRDCTVPDKVEIAFVVDATGSMSDEIKYLKEELQDILVKVSAKDPLLDLHTGAVFYRDKNDAYVTKVQPFTAGISNTINFVKEQFADGGGDYPEALKDALEDAVDKMEWSADARTKIMFVLMDAPPHDEAKDAMATLIYKAAAKGIRIVPVACSGTDKATEFIMRSMALATNGTYLFLTNDSGIGDDHIKPTTDEFKVELLNDLLQKVIEQMCFVNTCNEKKKNNEPVSFFTNTEKIKVYPNPTNGPLTLETNKELKEIFVADFTGKILLRTETSNKKEYKIDLSNFPSATYFIRYTTKENKTGAEKVVLIH